MRKTVTRMRGDVKRTRPVRFVQSVTAGGLGFTLMIVMGACAGPANRALSPDEQFGHRYEDYQGRRRTMTITPADTALSYFFYPVVVDSLHARPAPFDSTTGVMPQVPVEVLIKGALPDGCSELHAAEQWRAGHLIHLDLQMRRPRGATCIRVERPFRFYLMLGGLYEPGDYIIKAGDKVFSFTISSPASETASR